MVGFCMDFYSGTLYHMVMIIGIDEVGRGPIAGPVCVCAFFWKGSASTLTLKIAQESLKWNKSEKQKLKFADSKKLSKQDRKTWIPIIKKWQRDGKCDFAITLVHSKNIDKIGIAASIRRALEKSLYKVTTEKAANEKATNARLSVNHTVLLDGGLCAPAEFKNQKTIIKGDEKEAVIGLASILAKVHRDRHMARLAAKHPAYGFDSHVGYGTKAHYAAIKKHGLLPIHRRSFLTKILD